MTADDAVALALSQTHLRQELDSSVDLARSEVLEAGIWSNPEFTVSEERGSGDARETSVVLSQQIELGGRRGLRIDAAELGVRSAEVAARYERARLRAEVLRGYSQVMAAERLKEARQRTASGLEDLAGVAGKRQQSGDLSGYESRRIRQASAQAKADAALADTQAITARARLAGWVGNAAMTAELDASPPLPGVPALASDAESAELNVLAAERAQTAAQARAESRLALPINIGIGTKRVEDIGISDNVMILELGVPLPLFDRNQASRARAAAEAQMAEARYQRTLMQTRNRRPAAMAEARQLSESARTLLESAVPEAARLTAIARASFAEGELDLVGLLDAHQAESDVLQQALEQQSRALDAVLELELLAPLGSDSTQPTLLKE